MTGGSAIPQGTQISEHHATSSLVLLLHKPGLLQRRRTREDARAYAVKLTEEGWRVLESADPLAKRVDERVLAALPGPQRERFVQDLNAIVVALGKLEAAAALSGKEDGGPRE